MAIRFFYSNVEALQSAKNDFVPKVREQTMLQTLKKMVADELRWNAEMREFAVCERTELANQRQDDNNNKGVDALEITKVDFARRISLSELSMTAGGSFDAYFDDDDLFWNHMAGVDSTLKKGVQWADIQC